MAPGLSWLESLLALVYRERCAGCDAWAPGPLCAGCLSAWTPLPEGTCPRCASPAGGERCRACARLAPAFCGATATTAYLGMPRRVLHAFKFLAKRGLAKRGLAKPLAARLSETPGLPSGPCLVVPVPLTRSRLRERGYNQAALLARALAKRRGWPYGDVLRRTGESAPQHTLDRRERQANLEGAFRCTKVLAGAHVVLVDDVMTTGATVHWAALALLEAGAASVHVAVVARTMPPGYAL